MLRHWIETYTRAYSKPMFTGSPPVQYEGSSAQMLSRHLQAKAMKTECSSGRKTWCDIWWGGSGDVGAHGTTEQVSEVIDQGSEAEELSDCGLFRFPFFSFPFPGCKRTEPIMAGREEEGWRCPE